jgi:preprotein translocase subunit SecA
MTGTAETEAAELHEIYKLGVVPIPTNRPMIRTDQTDLIYKTEEAKFIAVVDDVVERYEKGQPVLIGTTSVERSEYLSRQFTKRGSRTTCSTPSTTSRRPTSSPRPAGGAITVATNMAGRGTDIVLGGNVDFLADKRLRERGLDPSRRRRSTRRPGTRPCARSRPKPRPRPRRSRGRRPVRAGHRAARVAPHRQPAARPLRPPGRPGRVPVLPVAG